MTQKRLTEEDIEAGRSPAGGFTEKQLAAWGVPWPPPKGWRHRLVYGDGPRPRGGSDGAPKPIVVGRTGAENVIDDDYDYPPWETGPASGQVTACLTFLQTCRIYSMDTVSIEEARRKLGEIVDRVRFTDEPTIITRQGKTAVFVVSSDWYRAAFHALAEHGKERQR